MELGDTLRERFRLDSVLGRGASGTTYLATDLGDRQRVVVKALSLAGLQEWRDFDALEREARVLASIHHPRVPRSVDSFSMEGAGGSTFVLVQQHIPGRNLERKVREGWRGTEEEVVQIATGLLRIVAAMHALRPPVIHRDINPRNVIAGDDGEVYLVDFGGVQDMVKRESTAGMTVTGTPGYAPLEQWSGNATERSDLYACAATALFLLTHVNPAELPSRDMRIDFRSVVKVSPALGYVLDGLLEPDEAKRTLEADRAIAILESGDSPEAAGEADEPPYGSRIRLSRANGALQLSVPERGSARVGATLLGFSAVWLLFVGFWTTMSMAMGAPIVFPLFSIPFWLAGAAMLRKGIGSFFGKTWVWIDDAGLRLRRRVVAPGRVISVPLSAIGAVGTQRSTAWQVNAPAARDGAPQLVKIQAGAKSFTFGEYLSDPERNWVRDTIRREIERRRA